MARLRIEQFKPTSVFTITIKFIYIGEQEKELISKTIEAVLEQQNQGFKYLLNLTNDLKGKEENKIFLVCDG